MGEDDGEDLPKTYSVALTGLLEMESAALGFG
jgi:hypothetical protein